jgi:hypothetical protein
LPGKKLPIRPKCGREEVAVCPTCGKPVDVYSRIVGFLGPVALWNDGKQEEFRNRVNYTFWGKQYLDELAGSTMNENLVIDGGKSQALKTHFMLGLFFRDEVRQAAGFSVGMVPSMPAEGPSRAL